MSGTTSPKTTREAIGSAARPTSLTLVLATQGAFGPGISETMDQKPERGKPGPFARDARRATDRAWQPQLSTSAPCGGILSVLCALFVSACPGRGKKRCMLEKHKETKGLLLSGESKPENLLRSSREGFIQAM